MESEQIDDETTTDDRVGNGENDDPRVLIAMARGLELPAGTGPPEDPDSPPVLARKARSGR